MAKRITREVAKNIAIEIAEMIDWESILPRANKCLIPEKDGVMTKERFIERISTYIYETGSPLKITEHGKGTKMDGIVSVSTSKKGNCNCEKMSEKIGTICNKCYAETYLDIRKELRFALACNYIILTSVILDDSWIPIIRNAFGRIESFGDLEMEKNGGLIQARNYVRIIKKNFRTKWAWWTKHPRLMQEAINLEEGKPKNLKCVYSSAKINTETRIDKIRKYAPCIDKVFTVFDNAYIAEYNVKINCGSRDCWGCGKCYTDESEVNYIREKLK